MTGWLDSHWSGSCQLAAANGGEHWSRFWHCIHWKWQVDMAFSCNYYWWILALLILILNLGLTFNSLVKVGGD